MCVSPHPPSQRIKEMATQAFVLDVEEAARLISNENFLGSGHQVWGRVAASFAK